MLKSMAAMVEQIKGLRSDFKAAISGPVDATDSDLPPSALPDPPQPMPTKSAAAGIRRQRDAARKGKRPGDAGQEGRA